MHLATLVVYCNAVLQAFSNTLIVNNYALLSSLGIDYYFKYIEQFSSIPSALAEESLSLKHIYVPAFQDFIQIQRPVEKELQICCIQALQHEYLTTGQEGSDDFEGRVLSRCTYKNDRTGFHCTQQGILLSLVEAMYFIYEKHRGCRGRKDILRLGCLDDFPYILDS